MTLKRRTTSQEERALFLESFREARPLARKTKSSAHAAKKTPHAHGTKSGTSETGINGTTSERLRRGLIEPEVRLDLHGYTVKAAHRALILFLRGAQKSGARLGLVVTGKGARAHDPHAPFDLGFDKHARGSLKSLTPRWLAEPELAQIVAASRPAHRRHGGAGALYVYLRKRPR